MRSHAKFSINGLNNSSITKLQLVSVYIVAITESGILPFFTEMGGNNEVCGDFPQAPARFGIRDTSGTLQEPVNRRSINRKL